MKSILISGLFLLALSSVTAQNVGVKLTAGTLPNTTLDVNGSASFREGTALTLANGANNDIALADYSFFRITGPTAAFSITGFTGGVDGRVLVLVNATTQTMSLSHQITSTAANQINTGGSTISIAANGVATLMYNATLSKWVVSGTNGAVSSGNDWALTGNSSTVDGTNFLGTTDNIPLSMRVNNQRSGYIGIAATGSTYMGYQAGLGMTNAIRNTFMGYQAGTANTTASANVAIGYNSLFTQSFSNGGVAWNSYNIAIGNDALYSNQPTASANSGARNVAVGSFALNANTTGYQNTAFGVNSLERNTIGYYNAALGDQTLYNNTTASSNIAIGSQALYLQSYTNGGVAWETDNIAIGTTALYSNQPTTATSGYRNVALGRSALYNNTTGSGNVSVGYLAGNVVTTGSNNTLIGNSANVSVGTLTNATAIGNGAVVNASNKVVIGNASATTVGGYGAWTNYSDGRYKKNVKEDVAGLDFILKLRPVTYNLDVTGINKWLGVRESDSAAVAQKERITQTGFIAQEVEQAAKSIKYDFSGVYKPQNECDNYALAYSEFVVPLVKAVQEQQVEIEKLKKENAQLKVQMEQLADLKASVEQLQKLLGQKPQNTERVDLNKAKSQDTTKQAYLNKSNSDL